VSEPIVFISHFGLKDGALEGFREMQREAVPQLEADKPRTLAFLYYLDEAGSEISIVHLFADADSMDAHFEGAAERAGRAYEYLVPRGWEIYGRPSPTALETMRRSAATAAVPLTLRPTYEAGFLR